MNQILAVLITAFSLLSIGQASAITGFNGQSLDSLHSQLFCAEDGDEKKKKEATEEDEEPECD